MPGVLGWRTLPHTGSGVCPLTGRNRAEQEGPSRCYKLLPRPLLLVSQNAEGPGTLPGRIFHEDPGFVLFFTGGGEEES